jgi:hypothetical protein
MTQKLLFALSLTFAMLTANRAAEAPHEGSRCAVSIGEIPEQDHQRLVGTTSSEQAVSELKRCHDGVPQLAEGYEDIYFRFLKGKLVYTPNKDNDEGRKEFPIASLANPLEGTFDLSGCGESAAHLQISTGFRTRVAPANANKLEVWIVPQFVLQKDPRAKAFNDFLQTLPDHRNKPFAILFTWGGWDDLSGHDVAGRAGNETDNLWAVLMNECTTHEDAWWWWERGNVYLESWQLSYINERSTDSELEKSRAAEQSVRVAELHRSEPPSGEAAQSLEVTSVTEQPLPQTIGGILVIPSIAKGYEEIYLRFLKGKLIYKPNKDNNEGRKEFPIAALANPLEGTFDISGCGGAAKELQISTGFRTRVDPANANKVEVWIVPQFVLQRDPRAKPFNDYLQACEKHRGKPYAILFTWGGWKEISWHEVTGITGEEDTPLFHVWRNAPMSSEGHMPKGDGWSVPRTLTPTVPTRQSLENFMVLFSDE